MRLRTALVLAISAATVAVAAAKDAGADNLAQLRTASAQTLSSVVRLSGANYSSLVLQSPRPYAIAVLFTASEAKYGCAGCAAALREMLLVARSYAIASGVRLNLTREEARAQSASGADTRTLFFGLVDFKSATEPFASHGFQSVPQMVLLPASTAVVEAPPAGGAFALPAGAVKTANDGHFTAENVKMWLPDGMGAQFALARPAADQQALLLAVTLALAIAGAVVSLDPSYWTLWRKSGVWCAVCFLAYAVSVSGYIGCIIRASPWYGRNRDGKPIWFSSSNSSHDQFVLEGVAFGLLNLGFALAIMALWSIARARWPSQTIKAIVGVVVLVGAGITLWHVVTIYQSKTPWYRIESLVSAKYWDTLRSAPATAAAWWRQAVQKELAGYLTRSLHRGGTQPTHPAAGQH